jgi:hypothetical protein
VADNQTSVTERWFYAQGVFGTLNAIALVVILGIISIGAVVLVVKLSRPR